MTDLDPRDLMARAQAGDVGAFGQLYALYRVDLLYIVRNRNRAEAEDIVQDTFVRALAKLDTWRDQGLSPRSWLATIAVHLCADRAKSAYARKVSPHSFDYDPVDSADPALDPAVIVEREETAREVAGALPALTALQRQAVTLHHLEGLRLKDTAAAVGCDVNAVKSVLFRARGTMRRVLADA